MSLIYTLFLPLLSALLAAFYSFSPKSKALGYFCSYLMFLSFLCALISLNLYAGVDKSLSLFSWISIINVNYGIYINSASLSMICVVTLVATCVHFYSIYYMQDDEKFNKYFSFLGLFVFSMLILVLSNNILLMFVGWEGVGLCSWLLIGFWHSNANYSKAANEAFIMNRISDFAMLLGIFLIYLNFNTFSFSNIIGMLSYIEILNQDNTLKLIAALLFIGAMGKSAQFPFHTWLANAMAGPTPVSALIHAATMVTAGVYLLIRLEPLYLLNTQVSYFIACLGTFVALFAASMAVVASDLKRIIAFSTLSQLGYMFTACGLGAYKIALFHLITHAFFKALLFLGAGNVMHAMNNELNIHKMGALFKTMKITAIFMIIASLALSGIYPFAGFFSKDLILDYSLHTKHYVLYAILLFTAFLTAFYSFRLLMLVFFAPSTNKNHTHEASFIALFAMLPLVVLAIIAGFFHTKFFAFTNTEELKSDYLLIIISLAVAFCGILFAIFKFKNKEKQCSCKIKKLLENEYYIPKFYEYFLINPYLKFSNCMRLFEEGLYTLIFEDAKKSLLYLCQKECKNGHLTQHIMFIFAFFIILILTILVVFYA